MAIMTVISRKPLSFVLPSMGLLGALFGILMGMSMGNAGLGIMIGAAVSVGLSYVTILSAAKEKMMRWSLFFLSLISGYYAFGPAGMIAGGLWGWFYGWFVFWLFEGRYRARLHSYLTSGQVLWHFTFRLICGAVFAYLIMPIIVVMPLSFNAQNYFTFTPEMLQFDPAGYSLKHYMDFFYATVGNFLENSLGIDKNLVGYVKVILAHSVLGIPFVIITVTATLVGFDNSLTRASANMGAGPVKTFFKVQMPLIMPGVVAGGLFAFITSFDEVVVIMFVGSSKQKTLPWQMFIGLKEQISPTILAVATILVCMSIALLVTLELLRRRSERLRGLSPS